MSMDAASLIKELEKRRIPYEIITVKLTPEQKKREKQIERDVVKYVMKIEEAHKKAANSELRFDGQVGRCI